MSILTNRHAKISSRTLLAVSLFSSVFVTTVSSLAAPSSSLQIPPEIEVQAQAVEERFNAALAAECTTQLCAPVGCEILRFKTLDQKQNSSLPGLDESDEAEAAGSPALQYKLDALRCEFTYEPTLSPEAVASVRQRVEAKIRQGGVTLAISGRKLNSPNPFVKGVGENAPAPAMASTSNESALATALSASLPTAVWIVLATLGMLALIWGYRRLGKSVPGSSIDSGAPQLAEQSKETVASNAAQASAVDASVNAVPSALAILNKRDSIAEILGSDPALAERTLEPVIAKGDVTEICRVLRHFGPSPLEAAAGKTGNAELFATVRMQYESEGSHSTDLDLWHFLERTERLIALAKLSRGQSSVIEDLSFLSELAADEFASLAKDLSPEELMSLLSFAPESLRARYLRNATPDLAEAFAWHVLRYPRISEKSVRSLAVRLRENLDTRRSEIKTVPRDQVALLEQLLNSIEGDQRANVLARVRTEQPLLFEKLVSETVLDRAVVHAPEAVLNDVFLTMSPEEAAAYLETHPDRELIISKLKAPLARSIRARGAAAAKRIGLSLDFIENDRGAASQARSKLTEAIVKKSATGELNLRRMNESSLGAL